MPLFVWLWFPMMWLSALWVRYLVHESTHGTYKPHRAYVHNATFVRQESEGAWCLLLDRKRQQTIDHTHTISDYPVLIYAQVYIQA